MCSPLEHNNIVVFDVHDPLLAPLSSEIYSASLYSIITFTNMVVILSVFALFSVQSMVLPSFGQYVVISLYNFICGLLRAQVVNFKVIKYLPLFLTVFIFILVCNLCGLIPFNYTVTGQLIQTVVLSISIFCGIVILAFDRMRYKFLGFFVPRSVPTSLIYFLTSIEIISYIIRPFSLSIRLFANMLAGHTLLSVISGFVMYTFSTKI